MIIILALFFECVDYGRSSVSFETVTDRKEYVLKHIENSVSYDCSVVLKGQIGDGIKVHLDGGIYPLLKIQII